MLDQRYISQSQNSSKIDSQTFKDEIKIRLNIKHPNLATYDSISENQNCIHIVQESFQKSLRQIIQENNANRYRMSQKEALHIVKQIRDGLQCWIGHGYIHTELKPQNVMLKGDVYKIRDFWNPDQVSLWRSSKNILAQNPQSGHNQKKPSKQYVIWANLSYYSPAIVQCADQKFDIYSVGMILYELLMGTLPFQKNDIVQFFTRINKGQQFKNMRNDLSAQVVQFLKRSICSHQKRMNFSQFLNHQIFKGKNQYNSSKQFDQYKFEKNFVMNNLRIKIKRSQIKVNGLLNKIDIQKKRQLNFNEFREFLQAIDHQISIELIKHIFREIDRSNRNVIELNDVHKLMKYYQIPI